MIVNDSNGIVYTTGSGVFTFNRTGNYLITWQINIDQNGGSEVSFGLNVGGTLISSMPAFLNRGQMSGSALITITTAGTTMSLVNNGSASVPYDTALDVRANIVITQVA